ncbi:cadherin-1 [Paralichthys olivaceus]|uniref:cadherin-1 n=1 Tax=Paralichthys olivaceus TaxID=8255 RepID=UPI003750AC87
MGTARLLAAGILFVAFQASALETTEEPKCVPGFKSDMLMFRVARKHLGPGTRLGRVGFTDCTNLTRFPFFSNDSRFMVQMDGILMVRREVVLQGHLDFSIHFWNSHGQKMTVPVKVVHHGHRHGHHHRPHQRKNNGQHQEEIHEHHQGEIHGHHRGKKHGQHQKETHGHHQQKTNGHHQQKIHEYHQGEIHGHHRGKKHGQHQEETNGHHQQKTHGHHQQKTHGHHQQKTHEHHQGKNHGHHRQKVEHHPGYNTENVTTPDVPVLTFPKSVVGLRRRKRDWVIPDINVAENHKGPYPHKVSQIRSNEDKVKTVYYSITGPGADEAPHGLFTMDRSTGILYVTQPLDREKVERYTFQAHAVAEGSGNAEDPMDIIVNVIDMNDNKPVFAQDTFLGQVPEASAKGFEVITVIATDIDEPGNANSDVRYRILSQDPELPSAQLFEINPVNGAIRVNAGGLDREHYPKYTLVIEAADMEGNGLTTSSKVILTVTDSNDNSPAFTQSSYEAAVPENKVDALVITMAVTDGDEPHSPAWNAKFKIVDGDPGGLFTVATASNKQEGIITTAKGLDFEKIKQHTLLVAVENEIPFATPLPTATATVVVNVQDVNEAPVFDPVEKLVSKREDLAVDSEVVQYIANDPDTARKQKVMYKIIRDPAGWLNVAKETGLIKVKSAMDRESHFVKDNKYTALIGAYDNDEVPATGTGTLIIKLEDVNDNAPVIEERAIRVCKKESAPHLLSVTDKDGPGFAAPYSVALQGMSRTNWTARMNDSKTGIILNLATELESGKYIVVLRVSDRQGMEQDNTVQAEVCDCTGKDVSCNERIAGGTSLPMILGILGGVLLLLMLVLLLLLFARRRGGEKKEPLLQDDDIRDNIYYYDEEGGGEDDQDYDLSVLHRGLDNKPDVFRNDVMPNFMPAPQYRPRPANPEEIGNFIDDNLKAADNDPTAPPYDSLLVFDYEGGGSDAGSLSSLNSSSSGDQDYNCLSEWGPRFKKLADMYGGGEDDML